MMMMMMMMMMMQYGADGGCGGGGDDDDDNAVFLGANGGLMTMMMMMMMMMKQQYSSGQTGCCACRCSFLLDSLNPDKVRSQDSESVISGIAGTRAGHLFAWRFLQQNWETVYRR